MIEKLFDLIASTAPAPTAQDLSAALEEPVDALKEDLDALCTEGRVVLTRKGRYCLPAAVGLTPARVGFQRNGAPVAYPLDGGPSIPIRLEKVLRPMPNDRVLIRRQEDRCVINDLLSRGTVTFPAYVRIERKAPRGAMKRRAEVKIIASAVPCDVRIPYEVVLTGDLSFVKNDEIALLKVEKYPEQNRPIYASVERVLGSSGSMLAMMKATAESQGFATELSEAVETESRAFPAEVLPDELEGREDLRGLNAFTIDGATAKDFDDAVSIEAIEGGWRLGVHIADVSHYVRTGSAIDEDAFNRGTSLYLPGYTVPMLPECLSNSLCSLMPDVDRLTLSLFMDIRGGKVVDHRLVKAVIHSHARLTYAAVNRLFDGDDTVNIAPEVRQALFDMRDLSHILRDRRHASGAIDFEMDEPEFVLNEEGEPEDVLLDSRGEGERIIEDFMLAANETVAALARSVELPFVYRVHEAPDSDRLQSLEAFLSELDMYVHIGPEPHPGVLQRVLEQAKEHPAADVIRHYLLRSLKKAQYSERPLGHYALSLRDYCHFTSPIRRYPDLTVHRMLKLLIDGQSAKVGRLTDQMPGIAEMCTQREYAATLAERDADSIMYAAWLSKQLGRKFDGVVSSITGWGLYVRLACGAEGLVHISTLDDFFEYDRERNLLRGEATGTVFRLGDRVRVRVERVSIPLGEINFELLPPRRDTAVDDTAEGIDG